MDQRFTDIQLPARLHGLISFSSDVNIAVTALRLSTAPGGDVFSTVAVNPDFTLGYHPVNDQEPNDTISNAQAISIPAEITGFKNATNLAPDPDFYSFNLQANQTIYVVGIADVMGSPVDIDLYLRDALGNQLRFVVNWAAGTTDALFSQQVFTTGKYYLQVVCGSGANSSGGAYRILVMAR
jgi:hypothetical protein